MFNQNTANRIIMTIICKKITVIKLQLEMFFSRPSILRFTFFIFSSFPSIALVVPAISPFCSSSVSPIIFPAYLMFKTLEYSYSMS